MSDGRRAVLPVPDEASRAYWAAAAERRLLLQRCAACGHVQFYPRGFCTACLEPAPEWFQASGRGTLHTFSVVHRTSDARFLALVPYALAIVELEEGPRMTTRMVDTPLERLRCELPVEVDFEDVGDGVLLPVFRERRG